MLDRAAEVGLLDAHSGGYYTIHPALPWYFRGLFGCYYPSEVGDTARRAFVEAIGALGDFYHNQYNEGNRRVLSALAAEEDNLLAAWRIALEYGWWPHVISVMQGLRTLYGETGRDRAWQALVENVVPYFVDPETDGPLPGRDEVWSLVTEYRVRLAGNVREWAVAERLQRARVEWNKRSAQPALETTADKWNDFPTERDPIARSVAPRTRTNPE